VIRRPKIIFELNVVKFYSISSLFADLISKQSFSLGELSPFNVAEWLRKVRVEYLIVALLKPFQDQQRLLRSRGCHQLHPPGQAYERVRKNPGTRVVNS
jgi:hypothetical protein